MIHHAYRRRVGIRLHVRIRYEAVHLLDNDFARFIADAVWDTSRNLRDCVSVGKLPINGYHNIAHWTEM